MMLLNSQLQVAEPLRNASVYYNSAAILLKLAITYEKYNIILQYACVITSPSRWTSMVNPMAMGNVNGYADYLYCFSMPS